MIETGAFLQQRYRIDKQIGQGGMGAVYLATDERFNSTVAIKETLCMNDNFRKALEREARLLNSLKHSALPRVSDHFLEGEGQFLVMEYVPGDDLMQTLERQGTPFAYEQVLNWADQILDALEYLHRQENPVIHRDIKPQNLKVTPKGQVILLDFGLAKGNVTDAGNLTAAKSIFGYSRNYASLEQIQGTGTDPRSDLYSLCATVYHLITGAAPEDALTRAMAVLSNQPDPLLPAMSVNPAIPEGLAAVLHHSLDLTAGRRPTSALDLRTRLREHERFAHESNFSSPYVQRETGASIFGTHTVANPETTRAGAGSEAVTQLLPGNESQVTSIRDARSNGERVQFAHRVSNATTSKRRLKYVFAGAFAIIAVFAASIGLLAFQEGLFDSHATEVESAPPVDQQSSDEAAASVSNNDEPVNSDPASATGSAPQEATAAGRERRATARTASNATAQTDPDEDIVLGDDNEKVVINSKSINAGNVKIMKGKIITPEGEFPFNQPYTPNVKIPAVPIDPALLTPEQRQRLRILRRNHPEVFVKAPPEPKSSPDF
ncbi:MAG: serine/threonine protein kinase [Pyrinomonadaceae bacterium]